MEVFLLVLIQVQAVQVVEEMVTCTPEDGTDGLGGGGGGQSNNSCTTTSAGKGGSGVVILRFLTSGNSWSANEWKEEGT